MVRSLDASLHRAYERVVRFSLLLLPVAALSACLSFTPIQAAESAPADIRVEKDIPYKSGDKLTDYEKARCKLDLYLPASGEDLPALVWFYGGALKAGEKNGKFTVQIAQRFARSGIAVAVVDYRLDPKVKYPAYIEDAAAAFLWVRQHAAAHRIDPLRVFVGGHSAGAYLTTMLGIDDRWLAPYNYTRNAIAGLIPVSGQMMTHYTVREERGIADKNIVTADEAAPINHLRKDTPPMLILFADHDMPTRREENLYFISALRAAGNTQEQHLQVDNRTHGSIANNMVNDGDPAAEAIIRFIANPAGNATSSAP